ncbi:MAG TPA: hypothetical protein VEF89_30590 [Solirubrobacteraceae bacterium]|nr:hypothetical protein [Solirubrobacteraceae bacterium]
MPYIFCDACGAGVHGNVLSCPECGAPARRVTMRRYRSFDRHDWAPREDVELEVREALYGRRSGAVERLSGV